jgi:hypothetical protein
MREANSLGSVEHERPGMLFEIAVVDGKVVAERGEIPIESLPFIGSEIQLRFVVAVENRAFVVVSLRAELRPVFPFGSGLVATGKVDALVERGVDVAGPEQADPAAGGMRAGGGRSESSCRYSAGRPA